MAVVSLPANAMLTAMVVTSESVMKFGWSVLAWINFDRRSGCVCGNGDVLVGSEECSFSKRSRMRSWANRATGKVTSIRPYVEARRYIGFLRNRRSKIGICPIYVVSVDAFSSVQQTELKGKRTGAT